MTEPTKHETLAGAIAYLRAEGHEVTEENIPWLYRINSGPEITEGQILQLSNQIAGYAEAGDPYLINYRWGSWNLRDCSRGLAIRTRDGWIEIHREPQYQDVADDDRLKPCPFCGGEAERLDFETVGTEFGDDPNAGGSCISCKTCGASSPVHFDRKENLVSSWNARRDHRSD